jgi:hypothetical protein
MSNSDQVQTVEHKIQALITFRIGQISIKIDGATATWEPSKIFQTIEPICALAICRIRYGDKIISSLFNALPHNDVQR